MLATHELIDDASEVFGKSSYTLGEHEARDVARVCEVREQ